MQEDQKLNRCVYCLVPRHLSESDFWRLYFSKTLAMWDSVKTHGMFPLPAPKAVAKEKKAKAAAVCAAGGGRLLLRGAVSGRRGVLASRSRRRRRRPRARRRRPRMHPRAAGTAAVVGAVVVSIQAIQ